MTTTKSKPRSPKKVAEKTNNNQAKAVPPAEATKAKKETKPRLTPEDRLNALLSGANTPNPWTLTNISTIRQAVVNKLSIPCKCGKSVAIPEKPESIVERDGKYFGTFKHSCGATSRVKIAAWSPAHTTYWNFRAGRPVEFVALDGCKLEKPTEKCKDGFHSFIKELGWANGGPEPQKRAKAEKKAVTSKPKKAAKKIANGKKAVKKAA